MKKWGALTTPSIAMKDGKPHINLSRLNRDILRAAGVPGTQLFQIGPCTGCAAEDFFSYRRARRRNRPADRCSGLAGDVTLRCNSVTFHQELRAMIPATEQHWLSESFVDPNGRLFEWRGELYRALDPVYAARWKQWAKSGVIDGLVRDGLLIESEWSGLKTDAGKAVLHHRRVAVQSYCYEWPPAMLRDAALLTIDLCIRLAEHGLTLQDGHPWNILFEGTKPVYVDAGSIVPARDDILWAPYQQFCNFFLYPLYLYAAGQDHIARWLMRDYLAGVSDGDLLAALPASFKLRHPRRTLGVAIPKAVSKLFEHLPEDMQQRFLSISKSANSGPGQGRLKLKFFTSLRKNIEGLELKPRTSHWARYYGHPDMQYFQTDLSPGDWQLKYQAVGKTLTDLRPKSVLDVGANTGRYSRPCRC